MDAIYDFASAYVRMKYEDIPGEAVEVVKKEVLDTLGVALAGSSKSGVRELLSIVEEWGGKEQSSVIACGMRCPAPSAAQVNATMAHALDYDDGHYQAIVHVGAVIVSTCFAMAERSGKVSGKKFISAATAGSDFMCRLGLATKAAGGHFKAGWHPTVVHGFLGAAAASSRILGLNEEKMVNALGIAYHQCSGNLQCIVDGALTKRMGPGFAARGGITAALMAERGISGARNSLEGEAGMFNLYSQGNYDRRILTADLGKRFETANIGFKPYPCCGFTHAFIDATLSLVRKHNIVAGDIREIVASGGQQGYALCVPGEVKRRPRNIVDAQFSVPWTIATAIARRNVSMEDFTEEAIKDAAVLDIARRVNAELDPALSRPGVEGGRVKVIMASGEVFSEQVDNPLGSAENPMTFGDCIRKFRDCAANQLPADRTDRVVRLVSRLEDLDDAGEVIRTCQPVERRMRAG